MRLTAFHDRHAALVLSWARDAVELEHWAALTQPPEPSIFEQWLADPDTSGHLLVDDDPVAYGELWVSEPEDEVELGHILVAPGVRGRGLGRRLVEALVGAARRFDVSAAWVRVVETNEPALRCYLGAGFSRVDAQQERTLNAVQPRAYRWLRRPMSP